jgi:hypothetical protein
VKFKQLMQEMEGHDLSIHEGMRLTDVEMRRQEVMIRIMVAVERLVELAESDYAEDEERLPRSLGER